MTDCRVVKVSVNAVVDGKKLDVIEFTLALGVNAIPRIELLCAPSVGGTATKEHPHVSKPTITDYQDLYNELSKDAEGLGKTGTITISVIEDQGETDTITLTDWVLSDVGLSSISAQAAPHLIVILQHRICKLTKFGSIYETPKSNIQKEIADVVEGCSKFTDIVDKVYQAVSEHNEWFYKTPTEAPKIWRSKLNEKEFRPSEYLVDESKLFLEQSDRMAQAEAVMALPLADGSSTWDMLLKTAGNMLLSVVQDQTYNYTKDKLVLQPTRPWKARTITLEQDWCFSTDIYGADPFKLAGVMTRKPTNGGEWLTLGIYYNGNIGETTEIADVTYVPPPYEANPEWADGRIIKTSAPVLLDMAFRADAEFGSAISLMSIQLQELRKTNYDDALQKYCKALYEITAMSMSTATSNMALYFHDAHQQLILPGNTCSFKADGGKPLFYGYITGVVHHGSVTGGCSTVVKMSYVRPEESYKVHGEAVAIPYDAPNAAYT